MKTVVITGSTRGIGYGLADAFLELGCQVVVSGRTPEGIEQAIKRLSEGPGEKHLLGRTCEVTDFDQLQTLWDTALSHFGKVDIWINNAGLGHFPRDWWQMPPEEIRAVVATNVIGAMYGARVALAGMRKQGFGALYNLEGMGSDGRKVAGMTLYGSTKRALGYLTDALVREVKGTTIIVGALRPGMVATDMVTRSYESKPEEWAKVKGLFNILSDRVETVTPWLARKMLENKKNGVRITWLTNRKLIWRFLTAPIRKRDVFGDISSRMK